MGEVGLVQRLLAVACLVAGVYMLAGPGWALLAAGALLWVRDDRTVAWATGRGQAARVRAAAGWRRVREAPRPVLAGSMMGAGALVAPTGVLLAAGVGVALIVAGALALGLSLLLGWGV